MLYIYYNSEIYIYIIENLKKQILEYGINVEVTSSISENNMGDLYIIYGMHNFHGQNVPRNYIVYQLEQSSGNIESGYFNDTYFNYMKGARAVWDYSLINYQYLDTHGIKADYKPIYPTHSRIPENESINFQDFKNDFIFIGMMNDRRAYIIDSLRQKGYTVAIPTNLYGDAYAEVLKSSKFALNIHYFKDAILETVRLSTLLEYGCKIISEVSIDRILDMEYSQSIIMTTYDKFVDKCIDCITQSTQDTQDTQNTQMYGKSLHFDKKTDYESSLRRYDYLLSGDVKEEDIPFVIKTTGSTGTVSLFVPVIPDDELPRISIVTPTYNRAHVFPLAIKNFRSITYPKNKIEWIIVNDSSELELKKYVIPKDANIAYYKLKTTGPLSIGRKRNFGIERSSGEYIVFMDDDDYYYPDSVYNRIALMLYYKKKCIGTTKLDIHDMIGGNSARINRELFSEASLAFKKTFWDEKHFNEDFHQLGEGYDFCIGRKHKIIDMPSAFNLIALTHNDNYTGSGRSVTSSTSNTSSSKEGSVNLLNILPMEDIQLIKKIFKSIKSDKSDKSNKSVKSNGSR